jgi:hypothetical protein
MKRDRVGRLIPSRPIEHLFYWPLLAVALYGVYLFANYAVELFRPVNRTFVAWLGSSLGEWALAGYILVVFLVGGGLYWWGSSRKPTVAPAPLLPRD